ncbi:hypothetical protein DRE_04275 [Drechslerella stenobrocha 248]|uniref:Uncharacterized protein n=1 Tax=Drechslerella stenobrocha 248 TaxID=1043628 RepID=W7I2F9_9PEZI|nr:hypothetical protein DRE_04275 [Drechslerella stenobrocha 248]
MFAGGAYPISYANDPISLFHLPQLQDQFQPQARGINIPPAATPVTLPDDLTDLDFSCPSLQEYLVNNDVLADIALGETPNPNTGLMFPDANRELLLNTPVPPNSPTTGIGCSSSSTDVLVDQYSTIQEETTLSLGIMAHLENLEKQIMEMKQFVARGFARRDNLRNFGVEGQRLQSRNYNFQHVTETSEPFEVLLRSSGELPTRYPLNGIELRSFSHEEMNGLLDEYDLPFNPLMFLHEKQLVYLKFIGANRAIMHRVVD